MDQTLIKAVRAHVDNVSAQIGTTTAVVDHSVDSNCPPGVTYLFPVGTAQYHHNGLIGKGRVVFLLPEAAYRISEDDIRCAGACVGYRIDGVLYAGDY